MKKVLVLTYLFPPWAGVGVIRVLKFTKFLPEWGWKPLVVCARQPGIQSWPSDDSLLEDIAPEVSIQATYSFEPVRFLKAVLDPLIRATRNLLGVARIKGKSLGLSLAWRLENIRDYDKRSGWVPFAAARGLILALSPQVAVIFSTSPPNGIHLAALVIKIISGKPWVADFRDPWILDVTKIRGRLFKFINHRAEKYVAKYADRVVVVNEVMREQIVSRCAINPDKIAVIPNGYDPDDYPKFTPGENDTFRILYSGSLGKRQRPDGFFQALASLKRRDSGITARNFQAIFIGWHGQEKYQKLSEELGISDWVEFRGFIPHKQACLQQASADAFLLIFSYGQLVEMFTSSKIYEYLYCRRPILATVPRNSEAARVLRELGVGKVVDPEDIESIADAIEELFVGSKQAVIQEEILLSRIEKYNRRYLTGQLADLMDQVAFESPKCSG